MSVLPPRVRSNGLAALLAVAWLLVLREPLTTMVGSAPRNSMIADALLVGGLLVLLIKHLLLVEVRPVLRATPLAIAIAAAAAHLVNAATAQIDLASGILLVVGAWGLLGLYVSPRRWVQALPLVLAGLCALPVGAALDLYVGFPLRMWTAGLTHSLLAPLAPGDLATETIILLDGGAAGVQIDLPCSGVRSLWSGAVFWAATTWLERTRISASWCASGVVFVALLVATNFARVIALVLLHAFASPVPTSVLHVPLGLIAFATACSLGWVLIHRLPKSPPIATDAAPADAAPAPIGWLVAALLAVAAIPFGELHAAKPASVVLPGDWAQPVAMNDRELQLFGSRGATAIGKWNVVRGRAAGQLLLIQSDSWRAQHRPDICLAANGHRIDENRTILIEADFPVRRLGLAGPKADTWAVYWFQSATQITDDHDARVWSALDGHAESWVMVSLVLDGAVTLADPDVLALLHAIRAQAQTLVTTPEPMR